MSKQNREQSRTARAAAIRAAQERKERNRRITLIVAIVVALGAIVAGGAWYTSGGPAKEADSSAKVSATATSVVVGEASAPVKITIYEDFLCPYCRQLEDQTRDFLRESAAKGKVQVTYQPINLLRQYDYSARALNTWAAVLKNSTPRAALELHDLLYDHQPYETASDGFTDADLAGLVAEARADNSEVESAMSSKDTAFFAAAQKAMTDAKVESTPTVYINGKEATGAGVPALVSEIEKAVQQG